MAIGNKLFVLLLMVFLHIVDDYYLQGWLASAKQKKYWEENAPDKMYKNDYKWALLMHGFSWSFMIMLPIVFCMNFCIDFVFIIWFIFNVLVHITVDDLKANEKEINLIQDQIAHLIQIVITFIIFLY
jgi:hypothetical protein